MSEDFLLALQLQEEYDLEITGTTSPTLDDDIVQIVHTVPGKSAVSTKTKDMSVVDPSWELLDPIPDIRALFLQFNDMFFWSKLSGVEVKWSSRMTLCAGVCSYEGRGGLCSIRLSEPLLKLRPRKDLVETLLHEMIHALLFVTHNNKDHDSHGPEFLKHMKRINDLTGAKISVYHNFGDEVDAYRKHWWLCNGPCKTRKPFYGYVKRAMNRAPSAADPWWADHQRTCGGTFIKVKEPENYSKKGNKMNPPSKSQPCNSCDSKGNKDYEILIRGVDIHTVIPFSGVGYKLVEHTNSSVPSTVQRANPHTSEIDKPLAQSTLGSLFLSNRPFISSQEKTIHSKTNVPKFSVANTKVFMNINGSPIKLQAYKSISTKGQNSSTGNGDIFSKKRQKTISFETPSSSVSKASTSQRLDCEESNMPPLKRPRTNGGKTLEDFFTSGKQIPKVPSTTESTASINASTTMHSLKVRCPICNGEFLEQNINDHLDACLSSTS
ncbi:DNA-dependent metalloprotease SPRTN [Pelodytes ibericus]